MANTTASFNFDEAQRPGYLGNAKVVGDLVGEFVHKDVLGADTPDMAVAACHRMSAIFAGKFDGYTTVDGWEKSIPAILYRQFKIDPRQTPEDMLTTFFMDLVEAIYGLVRELDGEELDRRIAMTANAYAQALLGINGSYAWAASDR